MRALATAWAPNVPSSWNVADDDCSHWEGLTCDYLGNVQNL